LTSAASHEDGSGNVRDAFDDLFDEGMEGKLQHVTNVPADGLLQWTVKARGVSPSAHGLFPRSALLQLLVAFINAHLEVLGAPGVTDLAAQLSDGVLLIQLIGVLGGFFVPFYNYKDPATTDEDKVRLPAAAEIAGPEDIVLTRKCRCWCGAVAAGERGVRVQADALAAGATRWRGRTRSVSPLRCTSIACRHGALTCGRVGLGGGLGPRRCGGSEAASDHAVVVSVVHGVPVARGGLKLCRSLVLCTVLRCELRVYVQLCAGDSAGLTSWISLRHVDMT